MTSKPKKQDKRRQQNKSRVQPERTQSESGSNRPQKDKEQDDPSESDMSKSGRKNSTDSMDKRKKIGGGGGGGGGGVAMTGGGGCDFCNPCGCGMCNIPLRMGAFVISIFMVIWFCLWVLDSIASFISMEYNDGAGDNPPVCWIKMFAPLFAIAILAISVLLLVGVLKENKCFVLIFCYGLIVGLIFTIIFSTTLHLWEHAGGGSRCVDLVEEDDSFDILGGVSTGGQGGLLDTFVEWGTYMPLGMCIWMWYPWWVCYAYAIELGANSLFGCC